MLKKSSMKLVDSIGWGVSYVFAGIDDYVTIVDVVDKPEWRNNGTTLVMATKLGFSPEKLLKVVFSLAHFTAYSGSDGMEYYKDRGRYIIKTVF